MKLSAKLALLVFISTCIIIIYTQVALAPALETYITLWLPQTKNYPWLFLLTKYLGIFFLAVMPMVVLIWLVIDRILVRPIISLNQVAKIISLGNLGVRADINTHDELGQLAENINLMVKNTASAFQNMANTLRENILKQNQLQSSLTQLEKARATAFGALEQLKVEKTKLEESKSKDDAILTNVGDGVVAVDRQGVIILFNWAASVISGFAPGVPEGKSYNQILKFKAEKNQIDIWDYVAAGLEGKKVDINRHLMLVRKDGVEVPISLSVSPITTANNLVEGSVVVFRDMTREYQLNKLKDEFVSVASHELRTPMTAIKGLVSMIEEGDYGQVNEALREPLKDIASSTDRLIHLINDLLDVSRMEAGRLKFSLAEISLAPIIKEITNSLQPLAKQKGIFIEANNILEVPIQADADKLKQVLNNLIGNAYKFTDQGGITIYTLEKGELVEIFVKDSGGGISPEDQKKLFSKFQQVSTQQQGRPPGTGLGLFISRELVKLMGGDIWIGESALGQGTTFVFTLPKAGSGAARQAREKIEKMMELKIN